MTDRGNDLALVEAALFLASQPLSRRALAKILGDVRLAYVDGLLEDLAGAYRDPERGIELVVEGGASQLRVKRDYIQRVAHLAPQQDISRPVLRTLAVIAYNHPMTQADLVRVRGNKAYGHVQELIDRDLIRSEPHGRTLLLHVTSEFLRHFGLSSVEEFRFHAPPSADVAASDTAPEGEEQVDEQAAAAGEEDVNDAGEAVSVTEETASAEDDVAEGASAEDEAAEDASAGDKDAEDASAGDKDAEDASVHGASEEDVSEEVLDTEDASEEDVQDAEDVSAEDEAAEDADGRTGRRSRRGGAVPEDREMIQSGDSGGT